jgi:hypothetical protein
MKTWSTLVLMVACAPLLMAQDGCSNAELRDRQIVDEQQRVYHTAQPVPQFEFSLEREVAIELYQARNQAVATHSVWRSMSGVIEGDCPSIGYPIPYDSSLTNPLQVSMSSGAVVAMAEPNGLYPGQGGAISTWVRCVTEVNSRRVTAPVYIESIVTTYPYPVEVDYDTNRVRPVGGAEPTVTISARTGR